MRFLPGEMEIDMGMIPAEKATRQSWTNLKPLPAQRSTLSVKRSFTRQEYERICLGFIPERMEDRWFIFVERDTLYVHRSWTGNCIYRLALIEDGTRYVAGEAIVNRDESQYAGGDDAYDEKLLMFLIDHLLLGERGPLPMPMAVPAGIATELHYHHVLGAGQRAEQAPVQVTVHGALGWLWRWLIWVVKR